MDSGRGNKMTPPRKWSKARVFHIPTEHAHDVNNIRVLVSLANPPKSIRTSIVHDEAFTMCLIT